MLDVQVAPLDGRVMGLSQGLVLELSGLSKRYGSVPAISGLDLRLDRGQIYGFLGRNGTGKSTALRLLMGLSRADRAELRLFGEPLRPGSIGLSQRVGYVAQEQHMYDWMKPAALGAFVGAFCPSWDAALYRDLLGRFDVSGTKSAYALRACRRPARFGAAHRRSPE